MPPGSWSKSPGKYKLELRVPGQAEDSVKGEFVVKETNPELDNTRPDFEQLYALASDATGLLVACRKRSRSKSRFAWQGSVHK